MFIWASMNSADQGVFPMDTAFKRRWDFTYLGIDDRDGDLHGKYVILAGQRVEWNKLRKAINDFLAKEKVNEDKQLGPYFIPKRIVVPHSGDMIDAKAFGEVFKNKVLMYLFEVRFQDGIRADSSMTVKSAAIPRSAKNSTRWE